MDFSGAYSESTVWDGCVKLYQDGQWPVATIVFLASILVPLLKLLGLFFLVFVTKFKSEYWRHERTWIFKTIDAIGPWAMLDVFLLAILVALVKLGSIATVLPGRGLVAFTAMVVFTILASASFDPTSIWDETDQNHDRLPEEFRGRRQAAPGKGDATPMELSRHVGRPRGGRPGGGLSRL